VKNIEAQKHLLHTGSAPTKHAGVIGQFGLLVKDRGE
jgi:hypothetical protein